MRIALGIEYDGSDFCGWQCQKEGRTVQGEVEAALSKVADEPVSVVCAGRTDTGVHATGQVIHFDTDVVRTIRSWMLGANANLPADVSVIWVQTISDDFHARFAARARSYRYVILNQMVRPALFRKRVCWIHQELSHEPMMEAAQTLLGENDYSAFRSSACQSKTAIRNIHCIEVARQGEFVIIDITANAFLHHMVRNLAGVLIAIGREEQSIAWPRQLLAARDRSISAPTAPAAGLYLVGVRYPDEFEIPRDYYRPQFA